MVDHQGPIAADPIARTAIARAEGLLRANPHVSTVVPPQPGAPLSPDGGTAVITAGAKADTNTMVAAADKLSKLLSGLATRR